MGFFSGLFGGSKKSAAGSGVSGGSKIFSGGDQNEPECTHKVISNKSASKCYICGKIICLHHWETYNSTQYRCMGCDEIINKF